MLCLEPPEENWKGCSHSKDTPPIPRNANSLHQELSTSRPEFIPHLTFRLCPQSSVPNLLLRQKKLSGYTLYGCYVISSAYVKMKDFKEGNGYKNCAKQEKGLDEICRRRETIAKSNSRVR
jgi:hypothetical protein